MSDDKKQPDSPWKVPNFTGLDKLADLMDKILDTQIQVSRDKIQRIQTMLEVKRKLEHKFPRDKK